MKLIKNFFKKENLVKTNPKKDIVIDEYKQIGRIIKEARINQNISLEHLSKISKIPLSTIISIEDDLENLRPRYPFLRSILLKLEECLKLQKYILVNIAKREINPVKEKGNINYLGNKLDLLNSKQGNIVYIFILLISIFILNKYYLNSKNIEFKIIESSINE